MEKLKRISVKVTYTVSLEDVDIPEDAKRHIIHFAQYGGRRVKDWTIFEDAIDWLNHNINESDSLGHEYEIIDLEE
jgi:hypothetical protein